MRLHITAAAAVDTTRRTLAGTVVRYGEIGLTTAGALAVAPGALTFPDDISAVPLTFEHDRGQIRGQLAALDDNGERIYVRVRVADGSAGDAALAEAAGLTPPSAGGPRRRIRAGLSFDIEDATVANGVITSGRVVAIGQVAEPAYNSARIDQIAASANGRNTTMLTDEQRARLAELQARTDLNDAENAELSALQTLATANPPAEQPQAPAATQQVAASIPAVPAGVPRPAVQAIETRPRDTFAAFVQRLTDALQNRLATGSGAAITAALSDINSTPNTPNIEQPAWSGELWSGVLYEPQWTDLFASGDLTAIEGAGWRFTKKLAIQDYAGDKAAIPSDTITTERSTYDAARMSVGVDVDRKFYDFPNAAFVASLWEQVRESWTIQLDAKIRAYTLANAVSAKQLDGITPVAAQPTLLKAAAVAVRALKRLKVGNATFVVVNDDDYFTLLDLAEKDLPVFMDMFNIDPKNFRSDASVPAGTVLAGVRQAATVRTLPGSPIRVDAQNIANGGVDTGFFGYWAIEEHHTSGIASSTFTPA